MLAFLSGLVISPSWIGKLRPKANRYAPAVTSFPDQNRIAAVQAGNVRSVGGELVGGFVGGAGAGSQADYWTLGEQSIGGWGDPIYQNIEGQPGRPASWYVPGDPGADRSDPTTLSDFDRFPNPNMTPWGGSSRTVNYRQHVLADRLNPPTRVTPSASDVYAAGAQRGDVIYRMWED